MTQHPTVRVGFLVSLMVLLGSGCVMTPRTSPDSAPPPPPPAASRPFTAAFASLPLSFDPYGPRGWYTAQVLPLVYNGLTTLDQQLQPLPALAADWDVSADGLIYTIRIRQGVLFHHGAELEAADIRYSFQRAIAAQGARGEPEPPFALIADIEIPDRYTIRFLLNEPYAPFLTKLTVGDCPIVSRQSPATSQLTPPGTGPFELTQMQPGQRMLLKKFAAYWEAALPRLESVVLRGIKEASVRLQLLRRGEIDYVLLEPLYEQMPFADMAPDVALAKSAPTGTFSLIFNTRQQPFANAKVRQAVAWALNKSVLTQQVLGPYGVAVNQPFNPMGSPWYAAVEDRWQDLTKARALLAAAGYPEGIQVTLPVVAEAVLLSKTALALEEQLRAAGIRVRVDRLPVQHVLSKMQRGEWDLLVRGEASPQDPDDVYFPAFHSSRVGSSNVSGYHTARTDALLNAARQTRDRPRRQQIYRHLVSQLQEEVPELYLFMARWTVAWRHAVHGYDRDLLHCCLLHSVTAIANQGFKTIWLEE